MKFFSRLFSRITPTWKFTSHVQIWQLHVSNKYLITEERDPEAKSITFSCLEIRTGTVIWKGMKFGEQWWQGIEQVTDDHLFLHGYKKPDMPEHRGIICVDIQNGNVLWKNDTLAFRAVDKTNVYAFKDQFEKRVFYRLQKESGDVAEQIETVPEIIDPHTPEVLLPQHLVDLHVLTEDIKKILSRCNRNGEYYTEYLLYKDLILFNIYRTIGEQRLANEFYIFDIQKQIQRLMVVLNTDTPYPVPDSFFIQNGILLYVVDRTTLVAHQL